MRKWMWIILVFPLIANAGYERNRARPVNQVIYGEIDSVRYISQQQLIQSQANGWKTLLGAVVGGVIGHQFGDGRGREVATAVGAITGAGVVNQQAQQEYRIEYQWVELLVKTEQGQLIDIIQDVDTDMLFSRGDSVRILYFDEGVRVDKAY
ncbi:glycine zipper 2TM domain-containing protein [Vibrio sp. JPW-9-11-11]|uniref:glycine zipper 2TM domain-containing protein n=1 Tax=Vibrio sp. JPW-9-11-11 TaxID=1416532 RepID=UPI0015947E7A|nr:glycine zipper 2TM domain-containing protein [Vibrio sp. JPW-9-11-11]NVD06276.1 glycine zipper 2TM domain-containing protein [Vibrio sp. JPW-9-11-11]